MIGHVMLLIVAAVIAPFCFWRAWKSGADGLDDQGNIKRGWNKLTITEAWVAIGAGLLIRAFVDIFFLFNPPPPSMNGALSR
ncbi:MAG: hypothetical protein WAJ88_19920 [Pseudolabrys sp.]